MEIVNLTDKEKKEIIEMAVDSAAKELLSAMIITKNPNFITCKIYTEPNKKGNGYILEFRKIN